MQRHDYLPSRGELETRQCFRLSRVRAAGKPRREQGGRRLGSVFASPRKAGMCRPESRALFATLLAWSTSGPVLDQLAAAEPSTNWSRSGSVEVLRSVTYAERGDRRLRWAFDMRLNRGRFLFRFVDFRRRAIEDFVVKSMECKMALEVRQSCLDLSRSRTDFPKRRLFMQLWEVV